jgi:hypothetical protein
MEALTGATVSTDDSPAKEVKGLDAFIERLVMRHPRLGLLIGWAGAISVLLGYAASALGHVSKIRLALFEYVGPRHIQWLHWAMWVSVVLLLAVGYSLAGFWFHKRYLRNETDRMKRRLGLAAIGVGFVAVIGVSAYGAIPAAPDTSKMLREVADRWRMDLLGTQNPDGGLRWSKVDRTVESQVWTTAQVLVAILQPEGRISEDSAAKIGHAFQFIDKVRLGEKNEGWGYFEYVPWGVTEIDAWVTIAYAKAFSMPERSKLLGADADSAKAKLTMCADVLKARAMSDGSWAPINQTDNLRFARTYSTVMAVWALLEVRRALNTEANDEYIKAGIDWLLQKSSLPQGGWVPNPDRRTQLESFPGLTAQVIFVLLQAPQEFDHLLLKGNFDGVLTEFSKWLAGEKVPLSSHSLLSRPISNNDRSHDSDRYLPRSKFMVESSTFLWYPWSLLACVELAMGADKRMEVDNFPGCQRLAARVNELIQFSHDEPISYVTAESLMAIDRLAARPVE